MKATGKVLKDMHGKIIARQFEGEVEKNRTTWVYESTPGSDFEFMQGVTIISND